jgi:hypothetical protein
MLSVNDNPQEIQTSDQTATPIGGRRRTNKMAASRMNVSVRSVERFRFVARHGIPELAKAIEAGTLNLGPAEKIARLPHNRQLAELQIALHPPKRTRPAWTIDSDVVQLEDQIDRMSRRWSDDDRGLVAAMLRLFADQLSGKPSVEDGEVAE